MKAREDTEESERSSTDAEVSMDGQCGNGADECPNEGCCVTGDTCPDSVSVTLENSHVLGVRNVEKHDAEETAESLVETQE